MLNNLTMNSRSERATRSPSISNNRYSLSPIEALLGTDDSILETIENEISGNAGIPETPAFVENLENRSVRESYSEHCDPSQAICCDIKRPFFDYEEPLKEEERESDFPNEEYEWQNQTLFDQALIDDAGGSDFSSPVERRRRSRETDRDPSELCDVDETGSSAVSDEFLFADLSLDLDEHGEFSVLRDSLPSAERPSSGYDRAYPTSNRDKKVAAQSNQLGSFYGLPEKVKTLIQKTKKIAALYDWQDECLGLKAVKKRTNLIYALPTSGGKTLVAEILMLREILCNKKNAIFVLPFVAIVQEKVQSMAHFALEFGFLVEEYASGKGQYPPVKRHRKNSIYICTIEKAQGLVNSLIELKRLNEIGIVVVDELHLLGEAGGRGATLEGLLAKLMYAGGGVHIVGMSATIGNLEEIAHFLKAEVYTQNFRPVEIKEYVKCENKIWLLNLRDEPIFTDEKKINYRYSETADKIDPDRIGGLVMDVVPNDSCLVFCSTRKNCESVALLLTRVMFSSVKTHREKEKEELLAALRYEGELCSVLAKTIGFGVAYHHSGLTSEERKLLEDAFKEGTLCVLCCTSTLAAGVNLPARRVILRRPYVGSEFMSLSKYKQMIGRAGRAGFGEIGESILICRQGEMSRVRELLTSRMDDCPSTLHSEEDRGINNLILSSVMLEIATTRSELHRLVGSTLMGVQQKCLNVDAKSITDDAITSLLKAAVLRIKRSGDFDPNVTVDIESQMNRDVDYRPKVKKGKRTVVLSTHTALEPTPLGRAAMKASVDLRCAYILYQDLKEAQTHMVLVNDLHIMYLVTPYDMAERIKPIGSVYYNVITSLPPSHMMTPRVLGINEVAIAKIRDGAIPKGVESRIINRFWLTLILYELWQHRPLYLVAEKYQVNRGVIQNLLSVAATFANSVVRFCQKCGMSASPEFAGTKFQDVVRDLLAIINNHRVLVDTHGFPKELQEFWAFTDLLTTFSKKLRYCCTADLEPLMELPAVKVGRARQLFAAGYKNLQSIATAKPEDLEAKIKYLSKKRIKQIIAAANLLLMEKVENLRDEAAEVLEGLDMSHFEFRPTPQCM